VTYQLYRGRKSQLANHPEISKNRLDASSNFERKIIMKKQNE